MLNYDTLLSDQVKKMKPSGIRKFFDLAAMMEGVISLGVGEPDFQTPWTVRKAAVDSLERKRMVYTANSGMADLRKEICHYLNRKYHLTYHPENETLVTVGGSEAIDLAIRATVNPGDEVLIVEPSFVCYKPIVELMHGVAVPISTKLKNKFKLTPEELRSHITERTKMLILPYPNNPTGTTLTKEELKKWVNYALANDCLIMYDSAYEAYIQDPNIPHSIYEIKGAKKVAIEFRSFSKTAGFTGVRCGYTIVPKELNAFTLAGERVPLNRMWNRRQCTKFNGTSYITQRGAEAVYSPEGKEQVRKTIDYYMANARIMRESLQSCGLRVYGGENAPYIWLKTPDGLSSWKFFDKLLYEVNIVGTPGVGFGPGGEGFLRLTAFGDRDDTLEAMSRLKKWLL